MQSNEKRDILYTISGIEVLARLPADVSGGSLLARVDEGVVPKMTLALQPTRLH